MQQHPAFIDRIQTDHKVIAFTFDDGPNAQYTPELLEIFRAYNGRATFFTIGQQIERSPEVTRAIHEEGHELGNHTYSHPRLTQVDRVQQLVEFEQCEKLIEQITGTKPATFRPPFLDFNEDVNALCESFGYKVISALNLGTEDYIQPGINQILNKTRGHLQPGSVLLFHDGYGNRSQTIEAVRILTSELADQDYQFVTISHLLQLERAV
jgi:peptidoglycan/xylan/chitin deacetylase (PgdA/CDA1 family)